MNDAKLKALSESLWSRPTEDAWAELESAIASSGVRYYKIVYLFSRLGREVDVRSSYLEIYSDSKQQVAKIPIYKVVGNGIEGSLSHLAGLANLDLA